MTVDERARAGLFLAMQYPVEVPGVSVSNFLRTAATAVRGEAPKLRTWVKEVNASMAQLGIDKAFAERSVNEGFSGGEKKRHEILQLELLKPKIAILDETDSGLDVDALRVVSEGVNRVRETGVGTLLITHYTRILQLHQARLRPRVLRRSHRRVRWSRARRPARVGGLRPLRREGDCLRGELAARECDRMSLDVEAVRKDFPILSREVHGVPLVYLDSANSAQKPQVVIDAEADLYAHHYANVARAVHTLGSEVTHAYEGARDKVAAFLNAPSRDEVDLHPQHHRGAEPARVLVLERDDVPPAQNGSGSAPATRSWSPRWSTTATSCRGSSSRSRTGATFRWIPIDDEGRLVESAIDEVINERTKIVSFVYQSNALGTINPVQRIVARAPGGRRDRRSSTPPRPRRTCRSTCRTSAPTSSRFTGHKLYGPSGVGVLWGRYDLLAELPPFLGGGEMIETVTMERSTFAAPPHRFEAGTPMIAQAVALGTAVDYVTDLGLRQHPRAREGS